MLNLRSNAGMDMHQHRRNRLQALIEDRYGNDRKTFCDASDLSESRLAQLLSSSYRDGQGFGEKAARALEARLHLDVLYFDLNAVADSASRHLYQRHAKEAGRADGMIDIPQVKLKLRAGSARFKMEEITAGAMLWRFHKSWLDAHQLIADKLFGMTVNGASMEPRLHDGDQVLVDTTDTRFQDGAVYLINYAGVAIIKRMTLDFGRWHMSSDNTSRKQYQRQEYDEQTCIVIGRIIYLASERI